MWEQIASNKRKSVLMVITMAILLAAVGYVGGEAWIGRGGGYYGLFAAGIIWLVMSLFAYFSGDQLYLHMAGARKIKKEDLPVLYNVVEEMTIASGLPKMPDIYVIDDPAPNAFATGRKPENAAVAVTAGLLRICNRDELQGVIAHEIGHVRNRDILLMLFAGVMAGAVVLLADAGLRGFIWGDGGRSRRSDGGSGQGQAIIMLVGVVLMIVAPLIAHLIYFAISRKREYLADASSAVFTRYPEGLASALEKIASAPDHMPKVSRMAAPMYIVNPLKIKGDAMANATATHPPVNERVRILRAMTGASFADYDQGYRQIHGNGKGKGVVPRSAIDDVHAGSALRIGKARDLYRAPDEPTESVASGETGQPGERLAGTVAAAAMAAALASSAGQPSAPAEGEPPTDAESARHQTLDRAREVDDFFYRQDQYQRLECPCGAVLKIPPGFTGTQVECPRCGTVHQTSAFGSFALPD